MRKQNLILYTETINEITFMDCARIVASAIGSDVHRLLIDGRGQIEMVARHSLLDFILRNTTYTEALIRARMELESYPQFNVDNFKICGKLIERCGQLLEVRKLSTELELFHNVFHNEEHETDRDLQTY
jgi:hypothetical protein